MPPVSVRYMAYIMDTNEEERVKGITVEVRGGEGGSASFDGQGPINGAAGQLSRASIEQLRRL